MHVTYSYILAYNTHVVVTVGLTGAELHGCSYLADLCVREVEYEAVCVEVVGGAVCQCPPGMQGDGIQGNNHTGCQYRMYHTNN